jgi:hypothetical protein
MGMVVGNPVTFEVVVDALGRVVVELVVVKYVDEAVVLAG